MFHEYKIASIHTYNKRMPDDKLLLYIGRFIIQYTRRAKTNDTFFE